MLIKTNKKYLSLYVMLILSFCIFEQGAKAQRIAIKANALHYLACSPNIQTEFVVGEHFSINLPITGSYKPYGLDTKLILFQPEFRYWFNGRPFVREYIGVAAMVASYDINHHGYSYVGDALALGLTGGYALPIGKRWNVEFTGGLGVMYFHQKRSEGFKLMPMNLGVSFSFII